MPRAAVALAEVQAAGQELAARELEVARVLEARPVVGQLAVEGRSPMPDRLALLRLTAAPRSI